MKRFRVPVARAAVLVLALAALMRVAPAEALCSAAPTGSTSDGALKFMDPPAYGIVSGISSTNEGVLVYDSTNNVFKYCDGTNWQTLSTGTTIAAGSSGYVQFNTSNAFNADSNFYWDNTNKRLGIGLATPLQAFHLYSASTTDGSTKTQQAIVDTAAYNASPVAGIKFGTKYTAAGGTAGLGAITVGKENATDGNYASYLALHTRTHGSAIAERLRIDSAGNVGIGTTSPTSAVTVIGSVDASVQFLGQASDTVSAPSFSWTGDTTTGVFRPAASTLAFSTGGTEAMRINSSNNVGIGVSPAYRLHVAETMTATSGSDYMQYNALTVTPSAASSANFYAGFNYLNFTGAYGTTNSALAGYNYAIHNGSGTITNLWGVLNTVYNNSSGTVTSGAASRSVYYNANALATTTTAYGAYNGVVANADAPTMTNAYGALNIASTGATTTTGTLITNAYGAYDVAQNSGTGTIAVAYGLLGRAYNASTGTITNAYSIRADLYNNGGGTVTNWYGLYVAAIAGTAPTTNRYPIYVADTGVNYFAGNVGIGTTTINATLDVNGYAKLKTNSAQPVACSATYRGSIAYTGGTTNYLCFCDGTSWKQVHSIATACTW